ncbi:MULTISPECIES: head maturation protease, ClpP-related [unclassified Paenibacillus]|nr:MULTISPECIES: head maturation protease, ClpP-related [unclassified Paenibacillus]MDF9845552.1 ATP-dependent Clp protease protease subunit [Paenibacillus sp. PastF-2]MDF9852136.1 ATP-dependent Clp protease protease subunit [Paenibacillus sp. PastM-2]MDF9858708.1 ATP-dependent Clp protease protease subunit [Paenibacillus sp. PastF-1]MDH6483972.1 ATP-dependent Clp protease protease subunit [Paenibacillus sp. PastH-2]
MIAKKIKLNGPVVSGGNSWIYDWLGMETISPKRVISELEKAGGDDVELYINSGGGSVFAGSEIYTALKEYKGKIKSKVTGVAASAATFFVLASDEVYVSPLGQLMIHNSATSTEGDRTAHNSSLELLEGVDKAIAKVYKAKTKLADKDILDLMQKTTWMNAERAVQLGFANGVLFDEEVDASNSFSLGNELPQDVIDKLKNELLKNALKDESILEAAASIDPVNQVNQRTERNGKPMKLEELKAQHPDLYNEVLSAGKAEGVTAERQRISDLNALAGAPGAAEIVANAIAEGKTAAEAAIDIVKASAERLTVEGQKRAADSKNSGVAAVPSDEAPEAPNDEAVQDAEAKALADEIKALRGGQR